jgi:hypothetical protein
MRPDTKNDQGPKRKAAGRVHPAATTCKGGVAPAGYAHSIADRIEPEGGFLQRRLQRFIRDRARYGEPGTCWWCGRRTWWRSRAFPDVVRCGFCSPPAPGVAVEWLGGGGSISGEIPGAGS